MSINKMGRIISCMVLFCFKSIATIRYVFQALCNLQLKNKALTISS